MRLYNDPNNNARQIFISGLAADKGPLFKAGIGPGYMPDETCPVKGRR